MASGYKMDQNARSKRLEFLRGTRVPQLQDDVVACEKELRLAREQLETAMKEVASLSEKVKGREPKVSDHALVRFLERHHGFDLDKFREEILTPVRVEAIKAGASTIKVGSTEMKVSDGVVVTVI